MKSISSLFTIFLMCNVMTYAQQIHRCGTDHAMEQLQQYDQGAEARFEAAELALEEYLANKPQMRTEGDGDILFIPTVVHVVWNNASQNISDAQVKSQIAVLNEDFQRLNADSTNTRPEFQGIAANTRIEFVLAQVDPNGDPTDGIDRKQSGKVSFDSGDSVYGWDNVKRSDRGGRDGWPRSDYMNIWVCNLDPGFGVLGYAYPPGGAAWQDGIVISYRYFGRIGANWPYDQGRTTTHEVGHWLGLNHIWGFGGCSSDDGVDDTPVSSTSYFGCPSATAASCTSLDNWENYMDYVDDRCMNMFTDGQCDRMRGIMETTRSSLQLSQAIYQLTGIEDLALSDGGVIYPNPASGTAVTLEFGASAPSQTDVTIFSQLGQVVKSSRINAGEIRAELDIAGLDAGLYLVRIERDGQLVTRRLVVSN